MPDISEGYPYFLQHWASHVWQAARASPVVIEDFQRAMAALGPGPHRSGDIAAALGVAVNSMGPVRSSLITNGMVWSPNHGNTGFTVPMFDQFMRRIMPQWPGT